MHEADVAALYRLGTRANAAMLKRLLSSIRSDRSAKARKEAGAVASCQLVFIAIEPLATIEIYFLRPLAEWIASGVVGVTLLTERDLHALYGKDVEGEDALNHWLHTLQKIQPAALVFCRYSGPNTEALMQWAKTTRTPTIFHLDDDLLDVPLELGPAKHRFHNHPARKGRVRMLMDTSDVIYVSTSVLAERVRRHAPRVPIRFGPHALAAETFAPHPPGVDETVIGYMSGSDHRHDLALALPAIVAVMDRHASVRFDLFGVTARPAQLDRFEGRVRLISSVADYAKFLEAFSHCGWHIALCPLAPSHFNETKSCIKWIECTSVGAVVVASRGLVYDECCADDCGVLVANEAVAWTEALEALVLSPEQRRVIVRNAQRRLASDYAIDAQRRQLLGLLQSVGVPLAPAAAASAK